MYAIEYNNINLVKFLIQTNKIIIDSKDSNIKTVLNKALECRICNN